MSNITKAKKRESICEEVRALARWFKVEEPLILFDHEDTEYDPTQRALHLSDRVYNKVGRTLIYHEFAHHLCEVHLGMAQAGHGFVFWKALAEVLRGAQVENYPWLTEYTQGVTYYERHLIPRLSPRRQARARYALAEHHRLSQAA